MLFLLLIRSGRSRDRLRVAQKLKFGMCAPQTPNVFQSALVGVGRRRTMTVMTISLLYFAGCPNWHVADERLRTALVAVGRPDDAVEHVLVSTPEEAEAAQFRGSPTVLVDGRDPFSDPDAPVGLACRLYRTDEGLTGSPTVEQLLAVLR